MHASIVIFRALTSASEQPCGLRRNPTVVSLQNAKAMDSTDLSQHAGQPQLPDALRITSACFIRMFNRSPVITNSKHCKHGEHKELVESYCQYTLGVALQLSSFYVQRALQLIAPRTVLHHLRCPGSKKHKTFRMAAPLPLQGWLPFSQNSATHVKSSCPSNSLCDDRK